MAIRILNSDRVKSVQGRPMYHCEFIKEQYWIIIIMKWKGISRIEHTINSLVCFEVYERIIEKKIII